ncbi:Hypothetical protein A7982_00754 [Minicystis rosea]|nr:Hypothetical protein A7982_00754 [Minicystis rosea]
MGPSGSTIMGRSRADSSLQGPARGPDRRSLRVSNADKDAELR